MWSKNSPKTYWAAIPSEARNLALPVQAGHGEGNQSEIPRFARNDNDDKGMTMARILLGGATKVHLLRGANAAARTPDGAQTRGPLEQGRRRFRGAAHHQGVSVFDFLR